MEKKQEQEISCSMMNPPVDIYQVGTEIVIGKIYKDSAFIVGADFSRYSTLSNVYADNSPTPMLLQDVFSYMRSYLDLLKHGYETEEE